MARDVATYAMDIAWSCLMDNAPGDAVRALVDYQPTSVRETARHIATVAARALSCDVAKKHMLKCDGAKFAMHEACKHRCNNAFKKFSCD